MFKRFTALVVLLSFSLIIAACGNGGNKEKEEKTAWDQIKKDGKLVVATSGTLYPTSYHDEKSKELTGYEVELVRELAKRLKLKVEFSEMAFDGMLTSVNSGKVDLAANDISITDERKEKFEFTKPYKYSYGTAMVRKDDLSGIKTLDDLKGKKAGGEATTVFMDIARKHGAKEVIYDNASSDQYMKDLAAGRTDVILNDYYLQRLAAAYYKDLNVTIHPDIKYYPNNQAIILKKGSTELAEKINAALDEMKEDGTLSKLSKQYYEGADVSQKPDVEFQD
ncbi:transporter substrate-binding domain-containing protein [Peribacillus deserti]|uniref:Amino acid ABC transporter substrate-binding protein n=1 Tax=Peribacillus deserti TaxID=673318 RepID=A0A2N5M334_9BACI|nr:transporter substrate-binding domain-containing protein [Peribacillus deserti]PLT28774.1 amino acid ABC transporter substrate-binding protein [Peribacillus deserti]